MRPPGSANLRLGLFAILALGSLGLKAAAGPAHDGMLTPRDGRFERAVSDKLESQHFATALKTFPYRSTLVLAERGDCRVAVRDAMEGAAFANVYAQDAREIGPVSYLYRGKRYARPPEFVVRLGRIEAEALHRLGLERPAPLLIAFAASPSCGSGDLGIGSTRLDS